MINREIPVDCNTHSTSIIEYIFQAYRSWNIKYIVYFYINFLGLLFLFTYTVIV